MSDFFSFQSEIDSKKVKSIDFIDPVLFTDENPQLYILLDEPIFKDKLQRFIKTIKALHHTPFCVLSSFAFIPSQKDLSKNIISLYGKQCINLTDYIPPYSKIITVGRSIYSITKSDDLSIEGFYDTIRWKTSFYDPQTQCRVYPCPAFYLWDMKDNFERFFVAKQLELANKAYIPRLRLPKPNLVDLPKEDVSSFLNKWLDYDGVTSFDLETSSLDPWEEGSFIICLTLSFDCENKKAYYLPYKDIDTDLLNTFFKNKKLVGNNVKFDMRWLRVKGNIDERNLHLYWDNMKSSHAINELQFSSLKSDTWLYTLYGGYDKELEDYKERYPKCKESYANIPHHILFPYATMDALVSLECYRQHQIEIDELDSICSLDNGYSIRRALEEIAFPTIAMFTDMECTGLEYDWEKCEILSEELQKDLERRSHIVRELIKAPDSLNLDSGDQLGAHLEKIGWENPGRSEKGLYVTNDDAYQYWTKKGRGSIVKELQEYTECSTVLKTFVGINKAKPTGYFKYRSSDNKIHGSFIPMMANSWRGRSTNPNLQNVIARSTVYLGGKKLHERVRECFIAPDSCVFSENDAAGLQLRIAATYSQDPVMLDIFKNKGGDMHSITGAAVFYSHGDLETFLQNKRSEPFSIWRQNSKAINFGFLFGASARTFATQTLAKEWTLQEAKDYIKEYKLEDRQKNFYEYLIKDIDSKKIIDKKIFLEDQLEFSYYWAAAEDIRNKFFKRYVGLEEWHKHQRMFAKKHGYVQSAFGPIRRTPYLVYQGKDDNKKRISNYENICLNSPVQNFEACYMMYNMTRLHKDIKYNTDSSLVGNIHDSFIGYVNYNELGLFKDTSLNYFHEQLDVMKGVPYRIEMGYADVHKGGVWGVTEHEF